MSAPLWTAEELQAATGGRLDARSVAVTGVSIDSRAIAHGDLFVALRDLRDGHDFASDALARGAVAALVDRDPPGVAAGAPLLRVADTLEGLAALGAAGRARTLAQVAAVTGSVGKTSTKEMLRRVLGATDAAVHAAEASYNNHWGVPLTLARMPRETRFAVIEIGMNHAGEITPLSRLARPHVALITTIGAAHVGHLGGLEAIAAEKACIMAGLEPGGTAVLPADTPFLPMLREAAGGARVVTFGEGGEVHALSVAADPEGSDITAEIGGRRVAFRLGTPGAHMVRNALAALAAAEALGADIEAGAVALQNFRALPGRGAQEKIRTPDGAGTATLIDEAYNGQPPSMRAALALLAQVPAERRLAVLGQMGELGDFAAEEHRALAGPAQQAADLVFTCGPLMRHLAEALPAPKAAAHAETAVELAPLVQRALRPGDAVLVKGSKATGMKAVVEALKSAGSRRA
jgi:UDP-N-acetylmuramoyl-tripeptide--D-alanyl-D-alanine ligase